MDDELWNSDATAEGSIRHRPVLYQEVLELVRPAEPGSVIVDATVGLGGHAEGLLRANPQATLIGIDRDPRALEIASTRLSSFGSRVRLFESRHESLIEILDDEKIESIGALIADLGVSSMQFDDAERGFSFRHDGPLDMRMSPSGQSARDLVRSLSERALEEILSDYGEEPMAKRIARAIVSARARGPIETTKELAEIVRSVKRPRPGAIDPATLTFQALRIATNGELEGLGDFIRDAVVRLNPRGRIAIISFHSLEDRIVKRTFRRLEGECSCPPEIPVCRCGAERVVEILTRRPIEASEEEVAANQRARSAKMRVAEKVESEVSIQSLHGEASAES